MSLLRSALGLKPKGHLATESDNPEIQEGNDELAVVMKGPLADVYTDALDKAYAKVGGDPSVSSEPSSETGQNVESGQLQLQPGQTDEPVEAGVIPEVTKVVLESMAMDQAAMQVLHGAMADEEPKDEEYMTLFAVDQTDIGPQEVIDVTNILNDTDKPENVTVLIDSVVPPNVDGTEASAEEKAEMQNMSVGLEHLVIGMGGKVVHSFKDFIAARAKK